MTLFESVFSSSPDGQSLMHVWSFLQCTSNLLLSKHKLWLLEAPSSLVPIHHVFLLLSWLVAPALQYLYRLQE